MNKSQSQAIYEFDISQMGFECHGRSESNPISQFWKHMVETQKSKLVWNSNNVLKGVGGLIEIADMSWRGAYNLIATPLIYEQTFEDVVHSKGDTTSTIAWKGGGRGSPRRLYKAPTDYTKPQKDYTKPRQTIQNVRNIKQKPEILDKYSKYRTRVATHINITWTIQ